jgi:hypothetical protein
MNEHSVTSQPLSPIPSDNLKRNLKVARPETDQSLPHIGLVGDTYTIILSGDDTNGRYCLIDMHIPPGGGPPSHRHDFEESFTLLEGEIEATFRGESPSCALGRQSISQRTRRTLSPTLPNERCGYCVSARRRAGRAIRTGRCPFDEPDRAAD